MDQGHFREKALYRSVNGVVLACIGLFMPFLGIVSVNWKNLLVLFTSLVLFVGISLLSARGKIVCLLCTTICLGASAAATGVHTSYAFLRAYLQWCLGHGINQEQWLGSFSLIHTVVLTAAAVFVQILTEKIKYLKIALACACAVGLPVCLFTHTALTHVGVVFVLVYIVTAYVEWLQTHRKKGKKSSLKMHMLWLSPFLGIYLLLMMAIPASENPFSWQWAVDIYHHVKESFLIMTQKLFNDSQEDFGATLIGFSDSAELDRMILGSDDREVMHIQAQGELATNVYLAGKVYDTFNGREWQQEYRSIEGERFLDAMETMYAVRRLDDAHRIDYLRVADIRIRYEFFNTRYLFTPLKIRNIQGTESELEYSFDGTDMVFAGPNEPGTEYDVSYYQINTEEELLRQLLESQNEPDEFFYWRNIAIEYEGQTDGRISMEDLEFYRRTIYENYLDEAVLSEEVESYLAEMIGDAETDLEKLLAIERELNSYTYTWQPDILPDEVTTAGEFLDYFLLESRQGYCTHFATAFVLLARAEGIPARYVQGFCVPMAGSSEAAVLSNMAHAWPEVYIEDVGWIPFEPTPGYGELRYTPWKASERGSTYHYERVEDEQGDMPVRPEEMAGANEGAESNEPETQETETGTGFGWRFIAPVLISLAILAGLAIALLVYHLLEKKRYQHMDSYEKMKAEVRKNLRLLAWLGLKRGEQETLQELHERGMRMPGMMSLHFIKDYEDMLYGEKEAGEEILEGVKAEQEQLWDLIKTEKKQSYIFYRMRMFLAGYR